MIIIKCCFSFWRCWRCLCLHDGMLTWKDDSTVWKHCDYHPLCIDGNYKQTYFSFVQEVVSISIHLFVLCFLCFGVVFHIYFFMLCFLCLHVWILNIFAFGCILILGPLYLLSMHFNVWCLPMYSMFWCTMFLLFHVPT